MPTFEPPAMYSFPPFFTLQISDTIRAKQLDEWRKFILSWAAAEKTTLLSIYNWKYWENKEINRKMSSDGIVAVCNLLVTEGQAQWKDAHHTTLQIQFRTIAEWANIIHKHISSLAYSGMLLTFFELHSGAVASGTEFEGIDPSLLLDVLNHLQSQGKVQLFPTDVLDEYGVKFLG